MNFFARTFSASALTVWLAVAAPGAAATNEAVREALVEALVEARLEADGLRARLEAVTFGTRGGGWTPDAGGGLLDAGDLEGLRLLDLNRELQMVILSGGRVQGLRSGMRFVLMRDAQPTARVRLTDVRREISGAVIEQTVARRSAAVSDRPVLLRQEN